MNINKRAHTYAAERMQQVIDNARLPRSINVTCDLGADRTPIIRYTIEEALIAPEFFEKEEKE